MKTLDTHESTCAWFAARDCAITSAVHKLSHTAAIQLAAARVSVGLSCCASTVYVNYRRRGVSVKAVGIHSSISFLSEGWRALGYELVLVPGGIIVRIPA